MKGWNRLSAEDLLVAFSLRIWNTALIIFGNLSIEIDNANLAAFEEGEDSSKFPFVDFEFLGFADHLGGGWICLLYTSDAADE